MVEKSALKGLSKEARNKILKIAKEDELKQHLASIPKKAKEIGTLWELRQEIVGNISKAKDNGDIPRSTTLEKIMSLPAEVAELSSMSNEEILGIHNKLFKRKKRAPNTQTTEGTESKTKPKRKKPSSKKA